ncbi:ABC-2 family transporter protein [Candidatus Woesearchaeota archaeon]|nr:ABC-2 family transporter protein [Candidatus Woesearchaeota archaeon]
MTSLKRYWRFWMKNLSLELQTEMMYKANLFFKMVSFIIADIISPLVALLIYTTTPGIPGWTFEQFILFQGSFILIFGLAHLFFTGFPAKVIEAVRDGSFDKYLVKPIRPLVQLTLSSWDIEGVAEVMTGLALVTWSMLKVGVAPPSLLLYAALIALGCLFIYSMLVIIASMAFLVVKSWALYDIMFKLSDFGRYPLTIYEGGLRFFLTFVFPIGVVAFYPADALVQGMLANALFKVVLPVGTVFCAALLLWRQAMRKYTSAGG